jgi:hypothetical protein
MKLNNADALISHRMARSKEAIQAAEIMFENGMLVFSMNRIYYAMFYAVQALFVLRDVSFSKHGQVKGYFNQNFIKTGIFSPEIGKLYNKAFEYRQKFDYVDFALPERDMVSEYIEEARIFNRKIHEYIQKQKRA